MKILIALLMMIIYVIPSFAQENPPVLSIPSVDITTTIAELPLNGISWDMTNAENNAGHLEGTANIGEGNTTIAGHTPGVFERLRDIQIGDIIIIETNGQSYSYIVTEIGITTPNDLTPIYPSQNNEITLITCEGNLRRWIKAEA